MSGAGRWGDLRARVLSAIVMVAVGAVGLWLGGAVFAAMIVVNVGLMMWELARMTAVAGRDHGLMLGAVAGVCLAAVINFAMPGVTVLLAVPAVIGVALPRRDRAVFAAYAVLIMMTGYAMIALRHEGGLALILWLIGVVVVSDIMGYFAGRILGGPKFWPKVSPKKTWSGTVAGWIGAVAVGVAFVAAGKGGADLIWLSPLVAFAGQMGDIAESWIKRRAGVKDSSQLIPGHGGVLDRFDALATAVVFVFVVARVTSLSVGG